MNTRKGHGDQIAKDLLKIKSLKVAIWVMGICIGLIILMIIWPENKFLDPLLILGGISWFVGWLTYVYFAIRMGIFHFNQGRVGMGVTSIFIPLIAIIYYGYKTQFYD